MKFIACGASVKGPGHIERAEPNQDALMLTAWRGGWLAAVADGLGSHQHSDIGAQRACQTARRVLRQNVSAFDLDQMLQSIHQRWLEAIKPHHTNTVATTLLLARVQANGVLHLAQLGDGLLLLRSGGQLFCLTSPRIGFGNQTYALGAQHRSDRWQQMQAVLTQPGDGIVLMSDGVADDLDATQLPQLMQTLYANLRCRNRRTGRIWLQTELGNWATPMHSDDKTLLAIFRKSK